MKKAKFIILFISIFLLCSCSKDIEIKPKIIDNKPNKEISIPQEEIQLQNMTLEEKLGQLIIIGMPQGLNKKMQSNIIKEIKPSGIILFERNYNNLEELIIIVNDFKKANANNPSPLFISIDEEGGTVSRLPKPAIKSPSARELGNADKEDLTYKNGLLCSSQLAAIGINMNFAPVLDIVDNKNNKLLFDRSYSKNKDIVSRHGVQFIKAMKANNVIAVAKHFPGHGATIEDSHIKLPTLRISKDQLYNRELIPYTKAIKEDLDAIMVGHISLPNIDSEDKPATMSHEIITEILRKKLNFDGIVITDDIEMLGFCDNGNITFKDAIIDSFNSGIDIFLTCHTIDTQKKVIETLKTSVINGTISIDRVNESVLRILKVKNKYALCDTNFADSKKVLELIKRVQ